MNLGAVHRWDNSEQCGICVRRAGAARKPLVRATDESPKEASIHLCELNNFQVQTDEIHCGEIGS